RFLGSGFVEPEQRSRRRSTRFNQVTMPHKPVQRILSLFHGALNPLLHESPARDALESVHCVRVSCKVTEYFLRGIGSGGFLFGQHVNSASSHLSWSRCIPIVKAREPHIVKMTRRKFLDGSIEARC